MVSAGTYKRYRSGSYCPICKEEYAYFPINCSAKTLREIGYSSNLKRISYDHILPKARYTNEIRKFLTNQGFKNKIYMCAACNSERADNNHCIAALILNRFRKGDKRFYNGS